MINYTMNLASKVLGIGDGTEDLFIFQSRVEEIVLSRGGRDRLASNCPCVRYAKGLTSSRVSLFFSATGLLFQSRQIELFSIRFLYRSKMETNQ